MAIWDNAANTVTCPTCGDALRFDSAIKCSICRSCGNVYDPGTLNITGKFRFIDVDEASEAEENKREYVCDACGAVVVTDKDTSATFCAFCGNPALISRRLQREFRPEYIIPFKVDKKRACQIFKDWVRTKKNVPRSFTSAGTLKKITGIYVPFWLINAECHAHVEGLGYINDGPDYRAVYEIRREILFKVRNVPFDGSKAISNFLMGAIEPFDFDELVPYDDGYIPGYYAKRYDQNALDMTDIIDIRLSKYAAQTGKLATSDSGMSGTGNYTDVMTDSSESYVKNLSQDYALLPVWFLNYEYKGESFTIVINGQTGKIAGEVPVRKKSVWGSALIKNLKWGIPALILIACAIIGITNIVVMRRPAWQRTIVDEAFWYGPETLCVILGAIGTLLGKKFIWGVYNMRMDNGFFRDTTPDVEEYFDFSFTPQLIDKQDKFLGFQKRVDTSNPNNRYKMSSFEWTWV